MNKNSIFMALIFWITVAATGTGGYYLGYNQGAKIASEIWNKKYQQDMEEISTDLNEMSRRMEEEKHGLAPDVLAGPTLDDRIGVNWHTDIEVTPDTISFPSRGVKIAKRKDGTISFIVVNGDTLSGGFIDGAGIDTWRIGNLYRHPEEDKP